MAPEVRPLLGVLRPEVDQRHLQHVVQAAGRTS
jgi:hypothetical protein